MKKIIIGVTLVALLIGVGIIGITNTDLVESINNDSLDKKLEKYVEKQRTSTEEHLNQLSSEELERIAKVYNIDSENKTTEEIIGEIIEAETKQFETWIDGLDIEEMSDVEYENFLEETRIASKERFSQLSFEELERIAKVYNIDSQNKTTEEIIEEIVESEIKPIEDSGIPLELIIAAAKDRFGDIEESWKESYE
ncbi:hypothetical protein [Chengkuizengella marina]|uniref:Uncharacterized protein n=1 Tax=Chengkuizengella marina TaxID=2507566 RepID=A0A6N9Q6I8_9BACL|nr:hypothetical protein [Chengkuizengella marina]NBI30400.1 hypothetical protein [Chengkuizengella marina]